MKNNKDSKSNNNSTSSNDNNKSLSNDNSESIRQNGQFWLFWPEFAQKWILRLEFWKSPDLESALPRYPMHQF